MGLAEQQALVGVANLGADALGRPLVGEQIGQHEERDARLAWQRQGRPVCGQLVVLARLERLLAVGAVDGQDLVGVEQQLCRGLARTFLHEEDALAVDGPCLPRRVQQVQTG